MIHQDEQLRTRVGPILTAGNVADAILEAIQSLNPEPIVQDKGSYVRVLCADQCVVTAEAIERFLGEPFHLPGDLERQMPSFKGDLTVDDAQAVWAYRGRTGE